MQTFSDLSPEFRLLLISACPDLLPEEIEKLVWLCAHGIDWTAFVALVDRHRVPGLVFQNLDRNARQYFPPPIYLELKTRFLENKRQSLVLTAELLRLTQRFEQAGIEVWSLKGPLMSQHLFGDIGVRHSKDLDLLVRPEAVERAEQILLASGYKRIWPNFALSPRQKKTYFAMYHHFAYLHPERQTNIELHWRILTYPVISKKSEQQMLLHARALFVSGTSLRFFTDEDLLVYLLMHGATHVWQRLKWLMDVVVFVRRGPLVNWTNVTIVMNENGLQRPLAQSMLLISHLFGLTLPEPLPRMVQSERAAPALAQYSIQNLLEPMDNYWSVARVLQYYFRLMQLKKDFKYRWFIVNRALVPSQGLDWKDLPLPDFLFPAYYVLRPFLWLWRRLRVRFWSKNTRTIGGAG